LEQIVSGNGRERAQYFFMIKFILSVASFEAISDGEEAMRKTKSA
jgi:hypothetical protein